MITKLTIYNFKKIKEQTYEFNKPVDLLVGYNNSGKSTILQSLAIWQFCVDEFSTSKRSGSTGIQVVLPNFTALPLPEFNYLWKDRTDRRKEKNKPQELIHIQIIVTWLTNEGEKVFGVDLRYESPQSIYAIPLAPEDSLTKGWDYFRECQEKLPRIAYVPPFSGLEPSEKRMDDGPIRQQIGKSQPGSVLRNLLLRVDDVDWTELSELVKKWFGVEIKKPQYDEKKDIHIKTEYKKSDEKKGKAYDIIAAGSGFHQILTLLAFIYGYKATVILLDEPDAHLHVKLQAEMIAFFQEQGQKRSLQFLIATHAEEFIRGVPISHIISLISGEPLRIRQDGNTDYLIQALAKIPNNEIVSLQQSPYIVYVEGESDIRILQAWIKICGAENIIKKLYFKAMQGGSKEEMQNNFTEHFKALRQIIPTVKRLMIFDYDGEDSHHPEPSNHALFEWKRKNIENYLLVPDAWKRAVEYEVGPLYMMALNEIIDDFFAGENLTLPPRSNWRTVQANIFIEVDGKKLLFDGNNSLFKRINKYNKMVALQREKIALFMAPEELHEDIYDLVDKLKYLVAE